MIQLKTFLKVIDNSGGLIVECINVIGQKRIASLGDEIVVSVKKARPLVVLEGASSKNSNLTAKLKKGEETY